MEISNIAKLYQNIWSWPIFRILRIKVKKEFYFYWPKYTDMTFRLTNIILFYLLNLLYITNQGEKGRHVGGFCKKKNPLIRIFI